MKEETKGRTWLRILSVVLVLMLLASTGIAVQEEQKTKKGNDNSNLEKFEAGTILVKHEGSDRIEKIHVPYGQEKKGLKEWGNKKDVEMASLNYRREISLIPNDPQFPSLWGMERIDAPSAWDIQTGNPDDVIAIIDTGVDCNHPDLVGVCTTAGWDFANNDNNPTDDNGHGTHVAGTIAAIGNNGIGVVGINWNAKIMPIKAFSSGGLANDYDLINAINFVKTNPNVTVVSNSWGGGGYNPIMEDVISSLIASGVVFVAAAGNDYGKNNDINPTYPCNYDGVICVAATDQRDNLAFFSNYGENTVEIAAPGTDICSTWLDGGYNCISGTSMATPHVAGVVALIVAQYPELKGNVPVITARLLGGAEYVTALDGMVQTGLLNAYNIFEYDVTPPADILDLTVVETSWNSATISWTSVGDDGIIDTANNYDIRYAPYSSSPIPFDWKTATQVSDEPIPQTAGLIETFEVSNLNSDTEYYFAIKAIDNIGNPSGISNIATGITTIPISIFYEDFESGLNGWTTDEIYNIWQLGMPISGPGQAYSGTNVWATNLAGDYFNNELDSLISPIISLRDIDSAVLNFHQYYNIEENWDGAIVSVSNDSGNTWVQIEPEGGYPEDRLNPSPNELGPIPAYNGFSREWVEASFNLFVYLDEDIQIKFTLGTDSSVTRTGWYIDNVMIIGETTTIPNNPPVAFDQSPDIDEDTSVDIILHGFDPEGIRITFRIVDQPINGVLVENLENNIVTYIPNENFNGVDVFTYVAFDGIQESESAIVEMMVWPVNDKPTANSQTIITNENTPVEIILTGNDIDENQIIYEIVNQPMNGILVLDDQFEINGMLSYIPCENCNGLDSFTFSVNDSTEESEIATVNITVLAVNHPPTTSDQIISTTRNKGIRVTATGNDIDGNPLIFDLISGPESGTFIPDTDFDISGKGLYSPNKGYIGTDRLTVSVSDGQFEVQSSIDITINKKGRKK